MLATYRLSFPQSFFSHVIEGHSGEVNCDRIGFNQEQDDLRLFFFQCSLGSLNPQLHQGKIECRMIALIALHSYGSSEFRVFIHLVVVIKWIIRQPNHPWICGVHCPVFPCGLNLQPSNAIAYPDPRRQWIYHKSDETAAQKYLYLQ